VTSPQGGIDTGLDAPFSSSGASSSSVVPGQFEVAVAGRPYRIDLAADLNGFRGEHFNRKSQPVLRSQADTGTTPGENSISREDLWRRTQESWHHGAGQTYLDRADSDSARFFSSKGLNVWDKWSLTLLNKTSLARSSANTNLRLTSAGSYSYLSDGNSLVYSPDLSQATPTFTTVTGTPASSCQWVTSDGYNVYAAYGASGIYSTTRGAAAATSFNTLACTLLGYVKGRLMAANANSIYNVLGSGAPPTALLTQANTDFTWVGFAEGPGFIYAAGFSGSRSLIYKITLTTDGTALSAPIVAGELPTGEIVRTIKGYLGFLLVGTDLGVRVASISSTGDLTFGSLIGTPAAVLNFEPADRFVWFGYSNYDSTSTGLGRLDLSVFNQPLTPAYASDLMATGQGAVTSISSFPHFSGVGSGRAFAVSGVGFYVQRIGLYVASGTLDTGRIAYGIADDKVALFVDVKSDFESDVSATLTTNTGAVVNMGTITTPVPFNAAQARGEYFSVALTMSSGPGLFTGTVTRMTLRAYPAPPRSFRFTVPILLHTKVTDLAGNDYYLDPYEERQTLEALLRSQALFVYQEGLHGYTVLLDDVSWIPVKQTSDENSYDGTLVLSMKEITI
jgi:hypothetical protein